MTVKPKGLKNSAGGAEPDSSSAMIGDRRNSVIPGDTLGRFKLVLSLVHKAFKTLR